MDTSNQTQTLLIVDDDPELRRVLTEALEAVGYDTMTAANGLEALDVTERRSVDCVISDIKMPEMDGVGLLTTLKKTKPTMPVVMITGFSGEDLRLKGLGADGFITKPFRLARIHRELRRVLDLAGADRSLIRSILIVEDNEAFRSTLIDITEAMGYEVLGVDNAERAMELLGSGQTDAVIADHRLPGMTGAELTRQIKNTMPDMPVVLMTGYGPSMNGETIDLGTADAFLTKPFPITQIGDILKSLEMSAG